MNAHTTGEKKTQSSAQLTNSMLSRYDIAAPGLNIITETRVIPHLLCVYSFLLQL